MNSRLIVVLLCACALVGCRSDPSIDLLESELRWMEDQLYLLDAELEQTVAELDSCRRENSTLRAEAGQPASRLKSNQPARVSDPQRPREPDLPDLTPPSVEPGLPAEPDVQLPEPSTTPPPLDGEDDDLEPNGFDIDQAAPSTAPVRRIVLNERLTGGYDFDDKPGDEGLLVVIQPQDEQGRFVAQGAAISVVVLDPTKTGADARVARWDFDAAEAASRMRETLFGQGIHLELPWPNQPPSSDRLQLFVRYTSPGGQRLEAKRDVAITPPAALAGGWTPAAPGRPPIARTARRDDSVRRGADGSSAPGPPLTTPRAEPPPGTAPPSAPPPARPAAAHRPRPVWQPYR